jgi:outer membrane scaffolding protein for murein synthesis (MipA/OmpV family)
MVIRATLERISKVNDDIFKATIASRRLLYLFVLLWACVPRAAWSQTPSPLQEWQYSSGIALEKLFEPNLPDWDVVLGAGGEYKPLYDGAELTRKQAGPVINVRYKDIAFASVGEGLGINLIHGKHYRGGIALGYDLGRLVSNDVGHLHGLGDIGRAPDVKVFASYVLSKSFPLVVRGDVRQIVGGADGMLADLGAYLPIPASSKRLIVLVGPSYTYADHRYMQKVFGVTATQSIASRYPVYGAHAGSDAVGFGFSATGFVTEHWLINMDAAVNRLLGSARGSPITQKTTQHALGLSVAYSW